jgi:hypothetical protein
MCHTIWFMLERLVGSGDDDAAIENEDGRTTVGMVRVMQA